MHIRRIMPALLLALVALIPVPAPTIAQDSLATPCGVVDAIGYPVDRLYEATIAAGYDDFALFRQRFGGIHVGLDIAFHRHGDPVYAVARGRVTYSDIEGWDINRGVVVVEHIFPTGQLYYSLYGHVEQTDTITLPPVGSCVERGDTVGAVGWPETGAPHLHYEIRDFLPDDGGPGYIDGNPLEAGWYHPLDFTHVWQARFDPAYTASWTFTQTPSVPPQVMPDGGAVMAAGNVITRQDAAGNRLWSLTSDGDVRGLAVLPDGRVVAHTVTGQALVLQGGRYAALWRVEDADERRSFVLAGLEGDPLLVFPIRGGGLSAYTTDGTRRWTLPTVGGEAAAVARLIAGQQHAQIAVVTRDTSINGAGRYQLRIVDTAGQVLYRVEHAQNPVIAPAVDGWRVLAGVDLLRVDSAATSAASSSAVQPVTVNAARMTAVQPAPGLMARMAVDLLGNVYLYLGDSERTLLAYDAQGRLRWRERYTAAGDLAPLLATDNGCLLYGLDAGGGLSVFDTVTGARVAFMDLYAGGSRTRQLEARLLVIEPGGEIRVNPGFLSLYAFDAATLGGETLAACVLG